MKTSLLLLLAVLVSLATRGPAGNAPAMRTYLGVMAREAPPELRAQLDVAPGFGLVVEEVEPESPAAQAGLERHDVLLRLGDQRLVTMEQLRALVEDARPGQQVELAVIRRGQRQTLPVTLGQIDLEELARREAVERQQQEERERRERMEREQMERAERERAELREKSEAEAGHLVTTAHSQARVIRRDESGEYELLIEDGKKSFVARPRDGGENRWDLDEEGVRDRIPEPFRDQLAELEKVQVGLAVPGMR
ncbi:MAG: PDZ domain-containing protein [Verrucomicrobiales bacterium]|nr:PDZ domain-containing protein [Verrucomicrobiales bacterium]